MEIPILLDPASRQSLQTQLYEQVRMLILGGRIKPGTSLPASRSLAEQLGVSRNTVLLSYDRLTAEGYLRARRAIGTFVSAELPEECLTTKRLTLGAEAGTPPTCIRQPIAFEGRAQAVVSQRRLAYDFWLGRPDPDSFPVRTWRRLINRKLASGTTRFTEYGDPAGLMELRRAIADHLGPARGITADPEQVIIVAGCQQGLSLTARLLLREGMQVAIENPAYQGAAYLYESCRVRLIPVRVDGGGLCVDELPEEGAALIYTTPSHQYPMGFTLSLERRLRLLDWARRTGTYVIEDDYDGDFRYCGSPLAALMGLDRHGSVIYAGTFSKSIGPGVRLGYLVVPRQLAGPARAAKALLDNGHPWLEQAVLAEFLAGSGYAGHLRRIRQIYAARRNFLIECLQKHFGAVTLSGTECGMHIAWHLSDDLPRAARLQEMGAERDVGVYTLKSGAACEFPGCAYSGRTVVLGFSSLDERQIRIGVERLAAAVDATLASGRTAPSLRAPSPASAQPAPPAG